MKKSHLLFWAAAAAGTAVAVHKLLRTNSPQDPSTPIPSPELPPMQYRPDRRGIPLSVLGYGCMRFTRKAGKIDLPKAESEVMTAIRAGVNYFDTAYFYPGNEVALGEILQRNACRSSVYLATKLPHPLVHRNSDFERYFQESCRRLQTEYIDYYLMHMLTDLASWERLVALGILDWIDAKKSSGQIRNIGFSFHGNTEMFLKILAAYDWDFCQIQYNYMDEFTQGGRKGLEAARAKGIPVIVMEPLRGGKLVSMLPAQAKRLIAEYPVSRSPAEWGLRWVWDQPEVTVVLSGMNTQAMVWENLRIAAQTLPHTLSDEEHAFIDQLKEAISGSLRIPCTGCGYCLPCPHHVDIPGAFHCYNMRGLDGPVSAKMAYIKLSAFQKEATAASQCTSCGRCEKHCPQQIPIRQSLQLAQKELEGPLYRGARLAARLLKIW